MIKERRLSHSLRMMCSGSLAVGLGLLAPPLQAQENDKEEEAPQQMQRVEITGSSIKRLVAEGALPITVIKADDFTKLGSTTAAEVLSNISGNQTNYTTTANVGAGRTVGAAADLRGLGPNKTLVLLNGRRLANAAFDGSAVDLNVIPVAALDRVEILRDGASAIYGTDAIGGVINFITKRSYTGLNLSAEGIAPEQSGGAEKRFNLSGGFGDLDKDGYNIFGVIDYHSQNAVKASDRRFSAPGGQNPGIGLNAGSGNSYPANYYDIDADKSGNPYAASGCRPPYAFAQDGVCRYNSQAVIGIVPKTEEIAVIGKGTFKLDADNTASVEYLHAQSKVKTYIAGDVFGGDGSGGSSDYVVNPNSPYYPGNGITPGSASGGPLSLNWRSVDAGQRVGESRNSTDRLLFSLDGTLAGWDYKTGLAYAMSKASEALVSGYLNSNMVREGFLSGILNPFGPQSAAGIDYLKRAQVSGVYLDAKTQVTSLDFTASRELFQLPAGPLGFALGGEFRKEQASFNVNHALSDLVESTGSQDSKSASGSRNVKALFTELNMPIVKSLEAQLALRYDSYSDVGSTVNPKVALRFQPAKEIMFRSSYSTGFRAPSLYELNDPNAKTYTAAPYNDPLLCPGGNVAPGGISARDCKQQFFKMQGGNKNLQPEKSNSFTLGMVIEPHPNFTASVDYWNIRIKDQISVIPESDIFGDPVKYADNFVRNPDGSLSHIIDTNVNLGNVHTSGFDLGFAWRWPKTAWGNFGLALDGTYVGQYDYQTEAGGDYLNNLAVYSGGGVIFRWRHAATFNWSRGPWSAALQQVHTTGYRDQNSSQVAEGYRNHQVGSYTRYNVSGSYAGFKNLTLTAGIKNLFNTDPPASNVIDNFQYGYDARYGDAIGRAFFVRANYQFF
ncbi:iron complex outermembrane receptor protein [Collimonas sp. PA-H2]|uniref:TonB-dependent receptor n=1 Tax=Collimonas sp. PA-H2 TaxID=1881062 RepID=UPI000BF3F914|nr:TonB-dependent receptor [Collimonas sp. PA-H2]PFH10451.1 iron complex outermembrane receptor protein [Collimonas sp. PA-H2]